MCDLKILRKLVAILLHGGSGGIRVMAQQVSCQLLQMYGQSLHVMNWEEVILTHVSVCGISQKVDSL